MTDICLYLDREFFTAVRTVHMAADLRASGIKFRQSEFIIFAIEIIYSARTMKSTNYYNTFIEIAEDCPAAEGETPVQRGTSKSAVQQQFDMIRHNPYKYTSDDVIFSVHAVRNGFNTEDEQIRDEFFSKGQPCLRASPLGKRYGWGIHCDESGKTALYPVNSREYKNFINSDTVKCIKAMRNKRTEQSK